MTPPEEVRHTTKLNYLHLQLFSISEQMSFIIWHQSAANNRPLWFYSCVKVEVAQSCLTVSPRTIYSPWNSPGQNTGVDSLSLFQWICPTQESNQDLLHCKWILYQLSYQGILILLIIVNYWILLVDIGKESEINGNWNCDPYLVFKIPSTSGHDI